MFRFDKHVLQRDHIDPLTCELAPGISAGVTGVQGWRDNMEDEHICEPICTGHSLVAVFDGHGGSGAAKYAKENFLPVLIKSEEWNAYWKAHQDGEVLQGDLLGIALKLAFRRLDHELRAFQASTFISVEMPDNLSCEMPNIFGCTVEMPDTSGCTATVTVITPSLIVCANAGDSRCALASGSEAIAMSNDHKPYNEVERQRIEASGGFVCGHGRVCGNLAVSRGFGDFEYKRRGDLDLDLDLDASQQMVTCEPEITIHVRKELDGILIVACDGLWDVVNNQEVLTWAGIFPTVGECNPLVIAKSLTDMAIDGEFNSRSKSSDNVSVLVVMFPGAVVGERLSLEVEEAKLKKLTDEQSAIYSEKRAAMPTPFDFTVSREIDAKYADRLKEIWEQSSILDYQIKVLRLATKHGEKKECEPQCGI
jgi:serine/threonine protein phosphatase PrpC